MGFFTWFAGKKEGQEVERVYRDSRAKLNKVTSVFVEGGSKGNQGLLPFYPKGPSIIIVHT